MSRVGKAPITLPDKVDLDISGTEVTVKGPLGSLKHAFGDKISVAREGNDVTITPADGSIGANAMSGTARALIANMVSGVTKGFEKKLNLVGVGYRAQASGQVLNLTLGFSHPVAHKMPDGIKVETPTQTEIIIKGTDKQRVGQVAAEVRAYRKPEPYKGKGVRYSDEVIVLKETKKK
jgi:large subunit ribosomal protein L6